MLLLTLLQLKVMLRLTQYYMLHCGGMIEDGSDSGLEVQPRTGKELAAWKRQYFVQRHLLALGMFAAKVVFFPLNLYARRQRHDDGSASSPPSGDS